MRLSQPPYTRKNKFYVCASPELVKSTAILNCEDAATSETRIRAKTATGIDIRRGKNRRMARLAGHVPDAEALDPVMNIFLQKRGKFENLAFTYGTFWRERVTIPLIARLRWST